MPVVVMPSTVNILTPNIEISLMSGAVVIEISSQEHYAKKKLRNWDLDVRTEDQNSQGVVGEVVFPNTVPPFFRKSVVTAQPPKPEDYELALAGNSCA